MAANSRQADVSAAFPPNDLPLDFYLVGPIDFEPALHLQRRLAYEVSDLHYPRLVVLLCEHSDLITVGRDGSRAHIRWTNEQLRRAGVKVQWLARGGGCIPHGRGQLAVYPIVPLRLVGWTVADYLRRLQAGIRAAIEQFNIATSLRAHAFGIWGHGGLLAAFGVAVRNGTTCHGAFLNVNPDMQLFHYVDAAASGGDPGVRPGRERPDGDEAAQAARPPVRTTMSSLLAERRLAVTMSGARTAVIDGLAQSFGSAPVHVHAALPSSFLTRGVAGESCTNL